MNIGKSLLLSPMVGFALAGLLLSLMKVVVKNRKLYEAPEGTAAATVLDSRSSGAYLHRREFRSRIE